MKLLIAERSSEYEPANFRLEMPVRHLFGDLKNLSLLLSQINAVDIHSPVRETLLPSLLEKAEQAAALQVRLHEQSEVLKLQLEELQTSEQELLNQLLRSKALVGQAASVIGSNPFLKRQTKNKSEQLLHILGKLLDVVYLRAEGTIEEKVKNATPLLKRVEQSL